MKKVLFIGRFQPFHSGHLSALEDIDRQKNIDEIIIGVGSSQYSNTPENPYTYYERERMIRVACQKIKTPFSIIAIPDIHNENLWVDHVIDIIGEVDEVYTGNDWVKELFKKKGYKVKNIEFKIKISGTRLREMITRHNNQWKKFVPANIINLIESAQTRINQKNK